MRWTTKSLRVLAAELTRQGHRVSADTVADLLHEEGFIPEGNAKTLEGRQHPDRDAQFRYINDQAKAHQGSGDPMVSVDTKKKELAGPFINGGREWRPAGEPAEVATHDFPDPDLGKAIPYGVYDVAANAGWVSAGTDHDTAAFAVESLRRWWQAQGGAAYPRARRLLITATRVARTATAPGRGRPSWPPSPPRRDWGSPAAISRRAPNAVACGLQTIVRERAAVGA